MSLLRSFLMEQADLSESKLPVVTLLFPALPNTPLEELLAGWAQGPATIEYEKNWVKDEWLIAEVRFGEHTLQLGGFPSQVSSLTLERSVASGHWEKEFKQAAFEHQAHLIIRYKGVSSKPLEQYLALYQFCQLFARLPEARRPVAIVNEPAWVSHPFNYTAQVADPAMEATVRESPPLVFWTGFLALDADGELWLLSRGHHLFGLPDLAFHAAPETHLLELQSLFHEIFHYGFYQTQDLQAGDILLVEPFGYHELLDGTELKQLFGGQGEILILRALTPEEVNQLDTSDQSQQPS